MGDTPNAPHRHGNPQCQGHRSSDQAFCRQWPVSVYPLTGNRRWHFKYRFGLRERLISFGVYPDISLKVARERRKEARRLVAMGIDPSMKRQSEKAAGADTFEAIGRERFQKFEPTWAATHSSKIIQRLERDVFPWPGRLPIADISAPEVLTTLRRIEGRGALDTAHRAQQNCSQVFRYAIATGRAVRDPCQDLKGALAPAQHQNYPSLIEPDEVAETFFGPCTH